LRNQRSFRQFTDEVLGKGIIRRLPGLYVFNDDISRSCPLVKDGTGRLWAVVNTNPFRISGDRADLIEKCCDLPSRD